MSYYTYASVASGVGNQVAIDVVNNQEIQIIKLDLGGPGLSIPVTGFLPVYDNTLNVTVTGFSTQNHLDLSQLHTDITTGLNGGLPAYLGVGGGLKISTADTSGSGVVTSSVPLVINTTNYGTLAFSSSGSWTGTITIEASMNGTDWLATTYVALLSGNTSSNFSSAITMGQINSGALIYIRFRSNTITGSANIYWNMHPMNSNVMLDNPLPTGNNVIGTVNVGTVSAGTQAVSGSVSVSNLPVALANGALKTNGSSVYNSFSTPSSAQSVSSPITLLTNGGAALGASMLGILVANTGTSDGWVATTSGAYMWIIPAGSYNYIPVGNSVTLYATVISGTAILTATEFGY